jgi:hypothetical protein
LPLFQTWRLPFLVFFLATDPNPSRWHRNFQICTTGHSSECGTKMPKSVKQDNNLSQNRAQETFGSGEIGCRTRPLLICSALSPSSGYSTAIH